MKKSELRHIIKEILKEQHSVPPNKLGRAPMSPSMSSGHVATMGRTGRNTTSNTNMEACASAVTNAGRLMNGNTLTENLWKRFRGALKKIFTNCGDLYDESGGPV